MRNQVLILEDDAERLRRFQAVVERWRGDLIIRSWRNAFAMLAELPEAIDRAILISLDHDLLPMMPNEDPGDGLEIAMWLHGHPPMCPVIVHSSNSARAQRMLGELELAGWDGVRVVPYGDDWIERDWRLAVTNSLRST